jgi:hypothetical protein
MSTRELLIMMAFIALISMLFFVAIAELLR